jgi:hypothetical protein
MDVIKYIRNFNQWVFKNLVTFVYVLDGRTCEVPETCSLAIITDKKDTYPDSGQ